MYGAIHKIANDIARSGSGSKDGIKSARHLVDFGRESVFLSQCLSLVALPYSQLGSFLHAALTQL
jgi:hypothetical protein